jgi:hypothetical protein
MQSLCVVSSTVSLSKTLIYISKWLTICFSSSLRTRSAASVLTTLISVLATLNGRVALRPRAIPNFTLSSSLQTETNLQNAAFQAPNKKNNSAILLDVTGIMCGACVSRVKSYSPQTRELNPPWSTC